MTIWKFPIPIMDTIQIEMPAEAKILCVQVQGDTPTLWAIVDPEALKVKRTFYVRGTGHQMYGAEKSLYVGTFQILGGSLVFHLFDGGVQ